MSQPELRDLQERSGVFQDISAVWPVDANVTGTGHPERIELLVISPNYFSLLGARPQIGRVLGSEDVALGFAEAVVISDGLWRREFGGDPKVIGHASSARWRRIHHRGSDASGISASREKHSRRMWRFGAPLDLPPIHFRQTTANAAHCFCQEPSRGFVRECRWRKRKRRLDSFAAQLRAQYPADYRPEGHFSIQLEPLKETIVGKVRPMLLTLLGAVGMMLLIGCVNIANLLLARAAGRQRGIRDSAIAGSGARKADSAIAY